MVLIRVLVSLCFLFQFMKKAIFKIAGLIVGAALIVVVLRGFVATSYLIPSSGMENTLYQGERIFVNKWSYGLRLPFMEWWGYHRCKNASAGKGEIIVFNNPGNLKESVISHREVFIGRVAGAPGDTLLVDSFFSVAPTEQFSPDQKFLYVYPSAKERQLDSLLSLLSIPCQPLMGQDSVCHIRSFSRYEYYLLEQALYGHCWIKPLKADTVQALRPLVIPARGQVVRVYPWNRALLCNTLVLHERRDSFIRNDTLFVDGEPAWHCRFTKNYYWVTADNIANMTDSRFFGLVPEDHLIGRAVFIWYSKMRDRIGQKIY